MSVSVNSSMAVEQVAAARVVQNHVEILAATDDEFDGVTVEMNEPMDPSVFGSRLTASICQWRQQGKKGIWIKVPIELVYLVEPAVKEGFWFHHAEPNYMMLVYWIPDSLNTLPKNATHRVGIGAFVMNEKREVLVVKENSGIFKKMNLWKFPTGVVEEGEDIWEAAVREVREETAIETEFMEILGFRQSHDFVVQNHVEILAATDDEFDGVIVEMNEPMDPTVFGSRLTASICKWRQQVVVLIYFVLFHYFSVRLQLHVLIEAQVLSLVQDLQLQFVNGDSRWWRKCTRKLKYEGNWVQDTHGSLMVVATVISSMTFQTAMNPPGGVWQENVIKHPGKSPFDCSEDNVCQAGTAVLARAWKSDYLWFVRYDTIAFVASLIVTLLLISGVPLKNKICMWLLSMVMCLSLTFMALTFVQGMYLVTPDNIEDSIDEIGNIFFYIWIAPLSMIGGYHTIRLLIWAVKKCWRQFVKRKAVQQRTSLLSAA